MCIKKINLLFTLSTALVLTGCELLPKKQTTRESIETPKVLETECIQKCASDTLNSELSYWINNNDSLGFFTWLDQSITENAKEILSLLSENQEKNKKEPFVNLFLALTLSYPNTGFRNTNGALDNLTVFEDSWLSQDNNKHFSLFVKRQLEDRKRMVEQRSELRKNLAEVKDELAKEQHKLEKEQDNAVSKQKQLDQLKSVEKTLLRQQSEETKKYRVVK